MLVFKSRINRWLPQSVLAAFVVAGTSAAHAHRETDVPLDETINVNGIDAMCTGIGVNERVEAAMRNFPVRIEITGADGQYLGDHIVEISGANLDGTVAVHCQGPWVLFNVPAGQYSVTSFPMHDGLSKTVSVNVSGADQDRVVVNFPELGGVVSPTQQSAASQ